MVVKLSKEAKTRRRRFILFLGLSLAVHFFLVMGIPSFLPNFSQTPKEPEPMMVDLTEPADATNGKQVVDSEKVDNDQLSKDAKYLGERNQTVEKETKARLVDTFRQGKGANSHAATPAIALKNLAPQANLSAKPTPDGEGPTAPQERQLAQQNAQTGGGGPAAAANNDDLQNVAEGDRTALSTKEFVYFGYYSRIRTKLEQAWYSRVRSIVESNYFGGVGRTVASNKSYLTQVVVELDRHGRITAIQIIEKSGARDLDRAAVEAFNQAGPFPDPPSGLVEKDGKIRIPWGFRVG